MKQEIQEISCAVCNHTRRVEKDELLGWSSFRQIRSLNVVDYELFFCCELCRKQAEKENLITRCREDAQLLSTVPKRKNLVILKCDNPACDASTEEDTLDQVIGGSSCGNWIHCTRHRVDMMDDGLTEVDVCSAKCLSAISSRLTHEFQEV